MQNTLTGIVQSGQGRGGYFVSLPGYSRQFLGRLGLVPYPGTLNLTVDSNLAKSFLADIKPIILSGFTDGEESFGGLKAYPVMVDGTSAYIVVPERTTHTAETLELIAGESLRDKLGLSDGDVMELTS